MAARGHLVFPIDDKNHRVLVIWDLNGYGEYEFDRCICDKVMACTSVGVRRRRNQNHNITEIFKFRGYNKSECVVLLKRAMQVIQVDSFWCRVANITILAEPNEIYFLTGCPRNQTISFTCRVFTA